MSSGATIIILPGWGHDSSMWEGVRSAFPEGTVRVIDLPGFGTEPLVSGDWGVPEYADWVKAKIETGAASNVILIGHSFGGRVAATIASERPPWLSALILYAAPVLYRPNAGTKARVGLAKLLKPFLPSSLKPENPELAAASALGLETVFRKTIPYDLTDKLPNISVPTLLLFGERDEYPPVSLGEEAAKLIPNAKLEVMRGAGHNAYIEQPSLFYGIVSKYVASL